MLFLLMPGIRYCSQICESTTKWFCIGFKSIVVTVIDAWNVQSKCYDFVTSHYQKSELFRKIIARKCYLENIINLENIKIYPENIIIYPEKIIIYLGNFTEKSLHINCQVLYDIILLKKLFMSLYFTLHSNIIIG